MNEQDECLDVAVVGGGVSGMYTAWNLLRAEHDDPGRIPATLRPDGTLRVGVFEGSARIGGRLLSVRPPSMPRTTCELGGMRIVSSQQRAMALVKQLGLALHEQAVDEPHNLVRLRGDILRFSELNQPDKLPYKLSEEERSFLGQPGSTASALLSWGILKLFPGIKGRSGDDLRDYLYTLKVDGTPLHHHGFWNLIARVLTHEAYVLATKTVGYDSLGANANAVDMIMEYFDFTPDSKYYLINDGFEDACWRMQAQIEALGGAVTTGAWATAIDEARLPDGSGGVAVELYERGSSRTVLARTVVLALPQRALELLRQRGPLLDPMRAPQVRRLMAAVESIPLYKMFLVYDTPWWRQSDVSQGRSLTDLPLRQCYYWATEVGPDGQDYGALMAYNDQGSVQFWGGLRLRPLGPDDTLPPHFHGSRPPIQVQAFVGRAGELPIDDDGPAGRLMRNWRAHPAPHGMVHEMHRQMQLLHGVSDAPEPVDAAFMDWADDPYGGAVHFWNPGHKSVDVLQAMIRPLEDFPCYVCGESWSTNQTWVEGALQTADLVLERMGVRVDGL